LLGSVAGAAVLNERGTLLMVVLLLVFMEVGVRVWIENREAVGVAVAGLGLGPGLED
jgi:hypothetical protein